MILRRHLPVKGKLRNFLGSTASLPPAPLWFIHFMPYQPYVYWHFWRENEEEYKIRMQVLNRSQYAFGPACWSPTTDRGVLGIAAQQPLGTALVYLWLGFQRTESDLWTNKSVANEMAMLSAWSSWSFWQQMIYLTITIDWRSWTVCLRKISA